MAEVKPITMNLSPVNGIPMNTLISQQNVDELANFELRSDDLFVVSYPKTGTTWTQQIVKLILSNGVDDGVPVLISWPWIEADEILRKRMGIPPQNLKSLPSPRTFKSHLPYFMMPGGNPARSLAKYIYVMRNPKDTAVSFFHHTRSILEYEYEGDWDDFFERFMSGNVDFGSWFDHVLQWWEYKASPNILFLKYEDLKEDSRGAVAKLAEFMDCTLESSTIESIVSQATFDNMRKNDFESSKYRRPGEAPHFRKGIVGDWMNYFSEEQSARMDAEFHKRFAGTGLDFVFE